MSILNFLRLVGVYLAQQEHRQRRHVLAIAKPRQQLEHERLDPVRMRHVNGGIRERVQDVQARLSHLLRAVLLRLEYSVFHHKCPKM